MELKTKETKVTANKRKGRSWTHLDTETLSSCIHWKLPKVTQEEELEKKNVPERFLFKANRPIEGETCKLGFCYLNPNFVPGSTPP